MKRFSKDRLQHFSSCCVLIILCFMLPFDALADDEGLSLSPRTNVKKAKHTLRARRIALLIGISKYRDRNWNDLRYPEKDAKKFHRFLSTTGHFDEIVRLDSKQDTTRRNIRKAFQWLKSRNRSPEDTILIYISGHGSIAQSSTGRAPERFLVVTDSTRDLPKTGIPIQEIKNLMERLPARRKALVLATCYVGSQSLQQAKSKSLPSGLKGTYQLGIVSRTTLILSAAGFMQAAYEMDRVQGDVYTFFFLDCAKNFVKQRKSATATEIHRCATQRTYRFVRKHLGREQIPAIESKILGKDTLFLVGHSPKERAPVHSSKKKRYGFVKLKRGKYRQVVFRPIGSKGGVQSLPLGELGQFGSLTFRLPEGRYTLYITDVRGRKEHFEVQIANGEHKIITSYGLLPSDTEADTDIDFDFEALPSGPSVMSLAFQADMIHPEQLPNVPSTLFGIRIGFWGDYAAFSVNFALGYGEDLFTKKLLDFPLFQLGLALHLGYTFSLGRADFFVGGFLEPGFWMVRSSVHDEMVFLLAYGPQVRFRWWFSDKTAFRFVLSGFFSLSPDLPASSKMDAFSEVPNKWTNRFHLSISVGFDQKMR